MSEQTYIDTIQQFYITYYGRAADPEGLTYWTGRLEHASGNISEILPHFVYSDESFFDVVNNRSNSSLIYIFYNNAFDRYPEQEERSVYLNALESGEMELSDVAEIILSQASGEDLNALNNKTYVANALTQEIAENRFTLSFETAIDVAASVVGDVGIDSSNLQSYIQDSGLMGTEFTAGLEHYLIKGQKEYVDTIQILYISIYGRPADPEGLVYWVGRLNEAGGDTSSIVNSFGHSDEFSLKYGGAYLLDDNESSLMSLFNNAFNGPITQEGIDFYLSKLNNNEYSLAEIALAVTSWVSGKDLVTLNNKVAVANVFTSLLAESDVSFNGMLAMYAASGLIKDISYNSHEFEYYIDLSSNLIQDFSADDDLTGPSRIEHIDTLEVVSINGELSESQGLVDGSNYGLLLNLRDKSYDEKGRLVQETFDGASDGIVDLTVDYSYDLWGSLIGKEESVDSDGDGVTDSISLIEYNSKGLITLQTEDDNADGVLDSQSRYKYDDRDSLVFEETIYPELDSNEENSVTRWAYEYDSHGNTVSRDKDVNNDGIFDSAEYFVYEYDSQRNISYLESDSDEHGRIHSWAFEYDDLGNVTQEKFNVIDAEQASFLVYSSYTLSYEYDSQGNKVKEHWDNTSDTSYYTQDPDSTSWFDYDYFREERADYAYYWEYDNSGNLTRYEEDLGGDGDIEYGVYQIYNTSDELVLVGTYGAPIELDDVLYPQFSWESL